MNGSSARRRGAAVTILLGVGLAALDLSVASLALPAVVDGLGLSPGTAVWVITATQLASVALLLPLAALGERLSYRRVYLGGAALLLIGSLGAGLSDSFASLLVARAVQGVGFAGALSVNSALIRLTYSKDRLAYGIALNSTVIAVCSVAGPLVAALLLTAGPWRLLFLLHAPLAFAMIVLGWKSLPANAPAEGPSGITPLDVVLNIVLFVLLLLGADALRLSARDDVRGAMVGALLLLACLPLGWIYIRRQRFVARPLLPVDLLKIPVFRLSMVTSVCGFAAHMVAFVALPFLLLEAQGRTAAEAGGVMVAWPVAVIPAAFIAARATRDHADGWVSGAGLALMAVGLLGAVLVMRQGTIPLVAMLALCGAGFGLFQAPNNHAIVTCTPPERAGATGGMIGTARTLGHSLGATAVAMVFELVPPTTHPPRSAIALIVAAALALVAAGFSVLRTRHDALPLAP